jgi:hypothetical protein
VTGSPLTTVALGEPTGDALAQVPAAAGVGQILGPDERNLVIGRAANLRKWVASHLGQGPPPKKKGARPRTDLTPIARALRFVATASEFGQRLRYARLMGAYVPIEKRRDMKAPAFLHVDETERFPRVLVRESGADHARLFGPFRDRAAAVRARDLVHKRFPLRPCDYAFEPDPAWPTGLGCVYAQVKTCAAPCLARIAEGDYRALAAEAAAFLASADAHAGALPPWIARLADARALVAERTKKGWELFAVREGSVVADALAEDAGLDDALAALAWTAAAPGPDLAWISGWLHTPKRKGVWLPVGASGEPLAQRVRAAFEQ